MDPNEQFVEDGSEDPAKMRARDRYPEVVVVVHPLSGCRENRLRTL